MTSNAVQGPQTPVALWVAAAWTRLRCCASSTMTEHRLDRRAWHPGPRARNATRGTFTTGC